MGKKNYTNGVITKRFGDDDIIPDGWYRGVAPMSEDRRREIAEKRKQTNLKKYGVENPSQAMEIKERKKNTLLERYGVENPSQVEGASEKAKRTNLERYGVENPSQLEDIKRKKRETCLENFGTEHPMQSAEVRERSIQTCIERYGAEHISQSDLYKKKYKKTCLERYGVENVAQSEEIRDKMRQSCIERYGTEYASQSAEVKEKAKATNLERYGVEYTFQADEIRDKIKQTNLERYGVENPFSSEEIQEKIKEAHKDRRGVEYPMQSEEVREKAKQTSLEIYGTLYPNQSKEVRDRILSSTLRHLGVKYPAQAEEVRDKMKETTLERYGVDYFFLLPEARKGHSKDSKPNLGFKKILEDNNIEYKREFHLGGYLYDFKVGNILIEIDPTVTHNIVWNPFGDNRGLRDDYHKIKSETAEEAGYRCIHIFDWDDVNKILELLIPKEMVYARRCEVRDVDLRDCNKFLDRYHLQGSCRGQSVIKGLYYNNELISLMSFGTPRYNKNYEYELLRYCSVKNVIGGAERLFKDFLREYNPKSVISYCDKAKFLGSVYKKLGFSKKDNVSISVHWYNSKEKRHITDNLLRQRGVDQLLGTSYGKGTSNKELMIQEGYLPVCDCGQDVWSYFN